MKESLQDKLIKRIKDMKRRELQLLEYVKIYKEEGDYANAMKNDIKHKQIKLIIQELKKLIS